MAKRIKTLIKELEALPHTEFPPEHKLRANFYPFSNERHIEVPITALESQEVKTFKKGTIRVAILIGQSSFCSLLSALSRHCDLVVFADINPYLITHIKRLLDLLQSSPNRSAFERDYAKFASDDLFKDFTPSQVTPDLAMRKKTLGNYHFLSSDEKFNQAQKAALSLKFAFSHVNLFHEEDRNRFFECFTKRKCAINFFNATNLYEWDSPTSLACVDSTSQWQPQGIVDKLFLKLAPYCPIIMHSLRENATESCPLRADISHTFEEYLAKNILASTRYLEAKFPLPKMLAPLEDLRPHLTPKMAHKKPLMSTPPPHPSAPFTSAISIPLPSAAIEPTVPFMQHPATSDLPVPAAKSFTPLRMLKNPKIPDASIQSKPTFEVNTKAIQKRKSTAGY